jgi:hypothetical protein
MEQSTMSHLCTINHALAVPAIVLDLIVIAIMGYTISGAVQDSKRVALLSSST